MGGKYYNIENLIRNNKQNFNPFLATTNFNNLSDQFLIEFFSSFFESLTLQKREEVFKNEILLMKEAIAKAINDKAFNFDQFIDYFNNQNGASIYKALQNWQENKLANIFNDKYESLINWESGIIAFELGGIFNKKLLLIPTLIYLFGLIEVQIAKNQPSIIVIENADEVINHPVFLPFFKKFFTRIEKNNAVIIFKIKTKNNKTGINNVKNNEKTQDISENKAIIEFIIKNSFHQFYFYNQGNLQNFNLDEDEKNIVLHLSEDNQQFLLKIDNSYVISQIDFTPESKLKDILNSSPEILMIANSLIDELSKAIDPKNISTEMWLKELVEVLNQLEKEHLATYQHELQRKRIEELKIRNS